MTNHEIMKKSIMSNVVSALAEKGFTGKYPHYRRIDRDCIELITFQTNKWGGSFTVEVSAIFPHSNDTNCTHKQIETESVTAWDTNNRYRLKGMYDGWFYYHDLYAKRVLGFGKVYHSVSENRKSSFVVPKGYRLVQEFSEEKAKAVCDEVNLQLKKAYKWLEKFKKRHSDRQSFG